MKLTASLPIFLFGLLIISLNTVAGVSLDRTRVIFHETDKDQVVSIINDTDKLYLVQNTIFNDYTNESNEAATQFVTIPPLARLEEKSSNAIRILSKDLSSQSADRESLFFFVVNLIPEGKRAKQDEINITVNFNIATKMILKVFYRPNSIVGNVDDLAGTLTFQTSNNQLIIKNPSGYYYTLEHLSLDGIRYQSERAPMIAPFSSLTLPITANIKQAEWRVINDFGGPSDLFKAQVKK